MADIPQPPENPFELENHGQDGPPIDMGGDQELPQGAPDVAARKGKAFFVVGVVGLVVVVLLYSIFSGGKKEAADIKPTVLHTAPASTVPPPLPPVATAPTIPIVPLAPPALPPAVTLQDITGANPMTPKEDSAAKAQMLARLKSGIFAGGGSGGGSLADALTGSSSKTSAASTDPNLAFAAGLNTTVERVQATKIGNLRRTIAQGRIIQATMESALNTDLPAPIRAIVSRDTYAEAGNVPLIPKGSRLIGSYNTAVTAGQSRVFVVWTRVIRPDGIDVMIGSPLVDQIGQAGVGGQVDTKFQEIFSRSLLSSVMNIAVAIGSDKIDGNNTTTTTNSAEGGSQTSGDAASTATTNALNRLGSVTDSFIQKFLNVQPTILVDQGTVVNVFVNKDLIFPEDAGGTHIIN